eukprot:gene2300-5651_t
MRSPVVLFLHSADTASLRQVADAAAGAAATAAVPGACYAIFLHEAGPHDWVRAETEMDRLVGTQLRPMSVWGGYGPGRMFAWTAAEDSYSPLLPDAAELASRARGVAGDASAAERVRAR